MNRSKIANDFRKDLIELLKKHNAELVVSQIDGLDLYFDIKDSKGTLIVADAILGDSMDSSEAIFGVSDIEKSMQIEDF
tara:strand:+ start:1941 stop:2177 length:237 start_codon:yes stop_codon:yes gene_type:complete